MLALSLSLKNFSTFVELSLSEMHLQKQGEN